MSNLTPGTRVRALKTTWVIQELVQTDNGLRLRATALEGGRTKLLNPEDGVEPLEAQAPSIEHPITQGAARLLRDALLLSTRRGAGPFRSLGGIAIQPHAYQVVPLMMALAQPTVRLLVADGTGIGKTVEAGLIVRELLDRGDIGRFTVLVPPHLVDQWVHELYTKFHLDAKAVTTRTIGALERVVPVGTPLFEHFPYTVVSLDYIKSDKRFAEFKHMCPECVVVDEVHTCVGGTSSQQRHRLLKALAQKSSRHLILCSATPHAGDVKGFGNLLALLNPAFAGWDALSPEARDALVPTLQRHLVQRARPDLTGWEAGEPRLFPQRDTRSAPYALSKASKQFFEAVFTHCKQRIETTADKDDRQRVFWSGMALLSCISSSPGAALAALSEATAEESAESENLAGVDEAVLEESEGGLSESDREPRKVLGAKAPRELIRQAQALVKQGPAGDGKLEALLAETRACLAAGHNVIVFCHFVSTADYVGAQLRRAFPDVQLAIVTGRIGDAAAREAAVHQLRDAPKRILVATDCLSEGVNLQSFFDAVIHYDLSWNPMRLQQRDGRVDRLGQNKPKVVCVTLHGPNNPIDAAMLTVLQRKASRIRLDLGVELWLPEQATDATRQLMGNLLTHGGRALQPLDSPAAALDQEATELQQIGAAQHKYAQQHLRPDEVIPEWRSAIASLGGFEDLEGFVIGALARMQATATRVAPHVYDVQLDSCLPYARQSFDNYKIRRSGRLRFSPPGQSLPDTVNRGHSLVTVLADLVEEQTRGKATDDVGLGFLGRCGCWTSRAVEETTVVLLVRLSHALGVDGKRHDVTETSALAWVESASVAVKRHAEALALLSEPAAGDVADVAKVRHMRAARALRDQRLPELGAYKQARAEVLMADHLRMRSASHESGEVFVTPLLLEEMGLFVLIPED